MVIQIECKKGHEIIKYSGSIMRKDEGCDKCCLDRSAIESKSYEKADICPDLDLIDLKECLLCECGHNPPCDPCKRSIEKYGCDCYYCSERQIKERIKKHE